MIKMCRRCLGDTSPTGLSSRGWCGYCERETASEKINGRSVHVYLPGDLLEWFDSLHNKSETVATACRQYLLDWRLRNQQE